MVEQTSSPPVEADNLHAEAKASHSLTYWQLVRRRFIRNSYGMMGFIICILIIFTALFAGFIAPYDAQSGNRKVLYSPPQLIKIHNSESGFQRPFVYGFTEEMDPNTFEIKFIPDPEKKAIIRFFVRGSEWSFLGIKSNIHLFGSDDGVRIYLLGSDNLGRDVLSRMIWGTRVSLLMGVLVVICALIVGSLVGMSAGFFGGLYDLIVQRIVEFFKAFPDLPLYLALTAILPRRADPIMIFIMFAGILFLLRWADLSREVRGKVLSMRSLDYVRAAEAVGASNSRILIRHVAPNISSHLIVWSTFQLPEVILLESFLSFLGVGVQPPMVSWGVMLNQILDFQSFAAAPWMMAPVGMIILTVLAFNACGDGLRDAMDPHSHG
ncbi:MAG: ABC transporter permease [Rhodobacteraceae bacterium]|nr:ABC transporter permease [Paracoccaceae bacterium]MCY4251378.1 ABC transporter permease [Paracoccaceae bacterium]MCY4309120.1 ABC transporter permease [Paracoccaceae bacterium]